MSYRISAKNRRFKRGFMKLLSIIKFDSIHLDNSHKTVAFGAILGMISLFLPWIEIADSDIVNNGFSKILGITGILLFLLNAFILFLLFHNKYKEIFKNMFHIFMKDSIGITFVSIFLLLTTTNSLFLIEGLHTFQQGILFGNGIILSIIGGVFCLFGGIMISRGKIQPTLFNSGSDYDENAYDLQRKIDEKNNMKLPF